MALKGKALLYSSFNNGILISFWFNDFKLHCRGKEKRIFLKLILSGVRRGEYLISVLFYPVIFALASVIFLSPYYG